MFLLKDVIEQLEDAEASLISLTDKKTGEIPSENYNKVIRFLNTAMSDLYTRITLVKGQCVIKTTEGKHSYKLDKANTITNDPINGFIVDDPEFPFVDTVLEITGVMTMQNRPLVFNQMDTYLRDVSPNLDKTYPIDECHRSFNSPKYGVLRTPVGLRDSLIKVSYKAGHTPIPEIPEPMLGEIDLESIVIDLPYPFLMPIVFYICSRANNSRGSERVGQSLRNEGATYFSKYLAEVGTIQTNMSQAQETTTPVDTFALKGFV